MKARVISVPLAFILVISLLGAPSQKLTPQAAKEQALSLHSSLMPYASSEVRAKITAAARAAIGYLQKCGQKCDLHAFLTQEVNRRFSLKTKKEIDLLETLVYAEMFRESSEMDSRPIQNILRKQQKVSQAVSSAGKISNDTALSIIRKIG
ncbi:MAG: hypothetical protein N3G18_10535 [Candidatus Saccharicenans sp.]|nr:hypothetical protein [Candidatus Saccharicenans sp.]